MVRRALTTAVALLALTAAAPAAGASRPGAFSVPSAGAVAPPVALGFRPRTTFRTRPYYRPRTRYVPRRYYRRSPLRGLGGGILRALGIAYLVHAVFGWGGGGGSPLGLFLLLAIVVWLVTRTRRRRYAYGPRW